MDFRRIPFQFSTTDPLKRQQELQRRFGLPAEKSNMFVDFAKPGVMGTRPDTSSASNSPRLQHRVPIFVEGQSEPTKPSVDAQNVDAGRKPRVRVIPIEIEGEDCTSKQRQRPSASSEPIKERRIPVETVQHPVRNLSTQSPKTPRMCNIPIKIEGSDHVIRPKTPMQTQKVKTPESPKSSGVKLNGCSASKVTKVDVQKEIPIVMEKKESPEEVTLKKIQKTEEKLKGYHADVEKFSGTNKEKRYRYLDEMLTRCMLELDEIDTMGLDTIRLARKAAIKKVQASVDLLESKITKEKEQVLREAMEVDSSSDDLLENSEDTDMRGEGAKNGGTLPNETCKNDQVTVEPTIASVEMKDTLPEQINAKVENISIVEVEDTVLKLDENEPVSIVADSTSEIDVADEKMISSPVQITEVGAEIAASEAEPVIEEPLSNSKDENSVDMDLDGCNCESDLKLSEDSSVEICEVENDTVSSSSKSEAGACGQSNQNVEMDMTDIPVVPEKTVLSSDNSQLPPGTNDY